MQVVESRLSSTTLAVISALLVRNPLLKLMPDDVAFLQPSPTPDKSIAVGLPPVLTDYYLFLQLLRQNLLLCESTLPRFSSSLCFGLGPLTLFLPTPRLLYRMHIAPSSRTTAVATTESGGFESPLDSGELELRHEVDEPKGSISETDFMFLYNQSVTPGPGSASDIGQVCPLCGLKGGTSQ